jgi:hypothetical protein
MTKGTPGPWETSLLDPCLIRDRNKQEIAIAYGGGTDRDAEARANARLMAATPNLLAVLKATHLSLARLHTGHGQAHVGRMECKHCRAVYEGAKAIRQAEGDELWA